MKVYNVDNIEEAPMQFRVPYREVKPIVRNAGKEVTNPMPVSYTHLSAATFAVVTTVGFAHHNYASASFGVRPAFKIKNR